METARMTDVRPSGIDPIQQIILDELRSTRREINDRLDKLVTTEAFQAEQRRVDERHESHVDAAENAHIQIRNDLDAKITTSSEGWKAAIAEINASKASMWTWFKWGIGTVFTVIALTFSVLAFFIK